MFKFIYYLLYTVLYPFYRYRFVGRENIPNEPCVLCGNHTANSDIIFMVLANGPQQDFGIIAKEELFRFKPLALLFRWLGGFPVKRSTNDMHAVKTCFSILKAGKKLMIFPEGTRVKAGMTAEPKPGAILFSVRGKVPLVPVYIPAGRKAFRKNTVVVGKPYYPAVEGKPDQQQYQKLAGELMEKIMALKAGEGEA